MPSTPASIRWLWSLCWTISLLLIPVVASAESSEIGFDLHTGKFSAPLPYMTPVQIGVDAPDRTLLTIRYWRRGGDAPCDIATARSERDQSRLVELTAVPAGNSSAGLSKLKVSLGPLSVGYDYCFDFDAKLRAPLSEDQTSLVLQSVFGALKDKALYLVRTTPTGASPAPGVQHIDQVAAKVKAQLSQTVGLDSVYDGPGSAAKSLADLVSDEYLKDKTLHSLLGGALDALYNDYRPLRFDQQKSALGRLPAGALGYHPVRRIGIVRQLLLKLKEKAAKQASKEDEDKLLATLYSNKSLIDELVKATSSRADLADVGEDLRTFKNATTQPKVILLSAYSLTQLQDAIDNALPRAAALGQISDETKSEVSAFLTLAAPGYATAAQAGWPRVGRGTGTQDDDAFVAIRAAKQVGAVLENHPALKTAQSLLSQSAPWKVFVAKLEVQTSLGIGMVSVPTIRPTLSDAFPAYLGLDVGIALAGMPSRSARFTAVAPIQYLGVSFLLSPIDKNDAVNARTPLRQRLGVNVGLDLLRPSYLADRGAKGLLGDRMLLIGLGFRATTYIRTSAGAVLFAYRNPAPFVGGETRLRVTWYISASIDFDVFGVIAGKYKSL